MKLSVLSSIESENTEFRDFAEQSDYFFQIGNLADRLNYSTLFLFKNAMNKKNLVIDPLLLQASLAPNVTNLRLGVGFAPLSFLDPIALAESCATLDVMSKGRLTIAIDEGVRLRENLAINLGSLQQERQNRENRDLLRMALRGERFTTRSGHRRTTNIQISVSPVQRPHPPIYTAVYDKQAAADAGASGFRIFLAPLAALRSESHVAEITASYRKEQRKAGIEGSDDDIIAFCLCHASDDNRKALEAGRAAFGRHALVRPNWVCRSFDEALEYSYFLVGGPTVLARKLAGLGKIGVGHIALMPTFGGLSMASTLDSMQVMADVVSSLRDPHDARPVDVSNPSNRIA